MIESTDPLMRAADLEKYTGIAAGTWRYYQAAGKGPKSFKLGGHRVWRKSVVDRWIADAEAATDGAA